MDLFKHARQKQVEAESPLANRMRPRTLDEFVGQDHIIGPGRLLRRAIQADQLSSLIFYGPPGSGKTTLANVIANTTSSHFITINAVLAGVKDIREAIAEADERRTLHNQRTTLFVDEVHRWNKAQQDALLPHVEKGTIILIGATTENPYFEVNKALVSRSRIFQLRGLDAADLRRIARQTLSLPQRGYGHLNVQIEPAALEHLVNVANGDARSLLNALELAVETTPPNEAGAIKIDLAVAEESIQRRAVLYDKDGDLHYDTISAFIKSLRGSDPDAALYWLAKMVYAGEDPRFLFRRMAIFASEDVGLADPHAVTVVNSCWELYEKIGMPEGQFPLGEAAVYLATADKSNSVLAFFDALRLVEEEEEAAVPSHLKDGNRDSQGFGHGKGYLYPHAYRDHWVAQQYLPDALQGRVFYQPSDQGYERAIQVEVARRREAQLAAMLEGDSTAAPGEIYSASPANRARDAWLQRALASSGRHLSEIRDRIFELAAVQRHHLVLDLQAGTGLLTWEAVRHAPEGGVWALADSEQSAAALSQQAAQLPELERPHILPAKTRKLPALPSGVVFDRMLGRDIWTQRDQWDVPWLAAWHNELAADGLAVFAQVIPHYGQRLHALVDWSQAADLADAVAAAEEAIYTDKDAPLTGWTESDLDIFFKAAGFTVKQRQLARFTEEKRITQAQFFRWFGGNNKIDEEAGTYLENLLAAGFTNEAVERVKWLFSQQLLPHTIRWHRTIAFYVLTP